MRVCFLSLKRTLEHGKKKQRKIFSNRMTLTDFSIDRMRSRNLVLSEALEVSKASFVKDGGYSTVTSG
jgi:hypothetical protein